MTAAELAHFRSLLQSQATPPKPPARSLFERMRGRLTLVERVDLPPVAEPAELDRLDLDQGASLAPAAPITWEQLLAPAAPPPRSPPAFGRRDSEGSAAPRLVLVQPAAADEPQAPPPEPPVRRRLLGPEVFSTPDEERPQPVAAVPRGEAPAPGVIAGWSRVRPPSAQRRILARLEAVFLVEQQGLEARLAAAWEPSPA